ncbi:hypothetical protein SBFV2_gp62 [Sulfolobales Beppu filamentous virus 2]|uniref:Uncharacterized protein n=1 Tax=Sulfolobales Beppu filamentous virus 2 TaxID=2493123 RepID=A0A3Q8Q3T8_9VIRU|nr:hypothetical protein HOU84_gp62 [Sulfolobales Beppu filamentous virus 2]AZI75829.1 hypothetical protein SBFV2_gp62 [Sulfolobales Beppu filamentous virus 2]
MVDMKLLKNANIELMITFGINIPEDENLRIQLLARMTDMIEIIERAIKLINSKYLGKPVDEYHLDMGLKITERIIDTQGIQDIDLDIQCDIDEENIKKTEFTNIKRIVYMDTVIGEIIKNIKMKKSLTLGYITLCYLKRDKEQKLLKAYDEALNFFKDLYIYYRYRNVMVSDPENENLKTLISKIKSKMPKPKDNKTEKNINVNENIDEFILEL